jgi:hypothetical protein
MRPYRHPLTPVASPGTSATVVLYQTSDGVTDPASKNQASPYSRLSVAINVSQTVTIKHLWGPTEMTTDANLVEVSSTSVTTGLKTYDFRLYPGRNKFTCIAGETPPTATSIAVELNCWPGVIT